MPASGEPVTHILTEEVLQSRTKCGLHCSAAGKQLESPQKNPLGSTRTGVSLLPARGWQLPECKFSQPSCSGVTNSCFTNSKQMLMTDGEAFACDQLWAPPGPAAGQRLSSASVPALLPGPTTCVADNIISKLKFSKMFWWPN